MSPYVVPDHRLASVQLERNTENLPKALTPTFWAELTVVPFDNLVDPAQPNATPSDDVPAELSQGSMDTDTTLSKLPDPQPPYVPHERFFFDDGNITFLVEGILYRVHRYFFCRDSSDFKDRLSRLSMQLDATPDSPPVIQLDDVKTVDFDAFLSVLYPQNFNTLEERSFEEWSSILDLSTRWGFTSIRDLAIRCLCLKPPSALHRLILARRHAIEEWVNPALLELCERPEPLSLDEARQMDFEDVVLLGSVRQNVRSSTLTTNGAGIRDCIQAWRNGEPWVPTPILVRSGRPPRPLTVAPPGPPFSLEPSLSPYPFPPGPRRNPLSYPVPPSRTPVAGLRPQEAASEEATTVSVAVAEPYNAEWEKPPSGPQTPLANFPEDTPAEAPPVGIASPSSFFVTSPDKGQDASQPTSGTPVSLAPGAVGGFVGTPQTPSGPGDLGWAKKGKRKPKCKCYGLESTAPVGPVE